MPGLIVGNKATRCCPKFEKKNPLVRKTKFYNTDFTYFANLIRELINNCCKLDKTRIDFDLYKISKTRRVDFVRFFVCLVKNSCHSSVYSATEPYFTR